METENTEMENTEVKDNTTMQDLDGLVDQLIERLLKRKMQDPSSFTPADHKADDKIIAEVKGEMAAVRTFFENTL